MLSKIKKYLTWMVLATFPIMSLVNVTPTLIMNLSLADAFVLLLGLVWLIDIRRFKLKKHFPYAWYFLLYLVILIISNVYNMRAPVNDGGVSGILAEAVKMITNAAFLFISYNAIQEEGDKAKNIFIAWVAGLYIFMAYGLYAQISQLSGHAPWMFNRVLGNHGRFLGTLTDANAAALYLSVSFFVVLAGMKYVFKSAGARGWLLTTNGLVLVCIILTMSRGGLIGFLCGLTLWFVCHIKTYLRYAFLLPAVLCLLLSVLFIDTHFLSNNMLRQLSNRVQDISREEGMLQTRLNLSMASLRMGLDHPIIGIGRGNFPFNSESYLIEQGVDWERKKWTYTNMVSHNTVAGVFAEMGTVGLMAFLSLFVWLFIKVLKNDRFDRDFKCLLFSLYAGVFVQSLAISLENARVLWLITGLTLCLVDKKIPFREAEAARSFRVGIGLNIGLTAACLIIGLLLYGYAGLRYTEGSLDISGSQLTLTYQAEQSGRYTLRYYVSTPRKNEEETEMEVSIRNAQTNEVINSTRYLSTTRGYANLRFEATPSESFIFEFVGRTESYLSDVKIIDPNGVTHALAGNYTLLPKGLYEYSQAKGYLVSNTPDTRVEKPLFQFGEPSEDDQTVLGENIRYRGTTITETEDGGQRFEFVFDCLAAMDRNYTFWMHLVADDVNTLHDGQRPQGFINCDHQVEIPTSEWQAGLEYRHVYTIHVAEGYYRLDFGFWTPPNGDNPETRLYTPDRKAGITPGWFKVG